MTPEEFQEKLAAQGIILADEQMQQFAKYYELLVEWNQKMNLTAITEKNEVYLKHFYDSLSPSFFVKEIQEESLMICDIGAGAGFPSIPLKIAFPKLQVSIVDSLNKRIGFLQVLVEELGLDHVKLYHSRAEDFGQQKDLRDSFDIVTARAVARLNVLAELCLPLVKINGRFLALKASHGTEELTEAEKAIAVLGGKFQEDAIFDLENGAGVRHILVVDKKKETPNKYPRKAGLPNKKPIV